MALEITGLAIGAAALVGTFKDCIDVFGMIVAARSLTEDAELLNTRLEVEKMLLLQWADRVGLTEPEKYNRKLDDVELNQAVARVLESIKGLLSDGKALQERYGLVNYQEVRQDIVLNSELGIKDGSTRLKYFSESLHRLSLNEYVPRKKHSVSRRFKWVVLDKERFSNLMDNLSYFVTRLDALVPAQGQPPTTVSKENLAQIRSIRQLRLIIHAYAVNQPQIAVMAQQAIENLNQGRILDRLWFRWIDNRKTSIGDRHFRTLDWALKPSERIRKWDNLAEWLKNGSGLYWLAGKAGSGKSTLMKYLSDHPQTTTLLKEWAGQSELVTLQFFFYALGRLEQKSQQGILRSLLFQFLDNHRDLIERALPAMWKEASITEDKDHELELPDNSEIQASIFQLVENISADKRFFILIDGLDEFEGRHTALAVFLAKLERRPNVKILVSSRPLPVFASVFDHAPKMYLQDLTKWDIEAYIDDTILHHPHIAHLTNAEPDMPMKIARMLTDKASGVFLWVVLACQSVLRGLDDYDTASELMNRVMELPPELHDFFRLIIAAMDPRQRDKNARLLRLVFESQTSSDFCLIPPMGLAIVEEQGLRADFVGPTVPILSPGDTVQRCQRLEGRLGSRCSGLVEIQKHFWNSLAEDLFAQGDILARCRIFSESVVVFMHRSLYEFLCTEGIWEWDVLRVNNECGAFEPHAILASLWTQLAHATQDKHWGILTKHQNRCLVSALVHNIRSAEANCSPHILATNLSRLQGLFTGDGPYERWECPSLWLPHQTRCRESYGELSLGLVLAAEFGMADLVQLALDDPNGLRYMLMPPEDGQVQDCSSFSTCPTRLYKLNRDRAGVKNVNRSTVFPLLYHATCRPFLRLLQSLILDNFQARYAITVNTGVVKYVLEKDHDPNEGFFTDQDALITTPWIEWLDMIRLGGWGFIHNDSSSLKDWAAGVEMIYHRAEITLLLVDAGAELGAPGTEFGNMVDESLSNYISNAARRSGRISVEIARNDNLWLKVRDTISSLRTAGIHQDTHS